jgi:hypothetical protein
MVHVVLLIIIGMRGDLKEYFGEAANTFFDSYEHNC